MRNIIFRGRSITHHGKKEEWVYGFYSNYKGVNGRTHYISSDNGNSVAVRGETVGQYTGLTDKNGNRIFEGDILNVEEYINMMSSSIFDSKEISEAYEAFTLDELKGKLVRSYVTPIVFEEGSFCISSHAADNEDYPDMFLACLYGDMKRSFPIFEFEVIGNIYDNPELLY